MATGHTKKQVFRTREAAKRSLSASRTLVGRLYELERLIDTDYYGRVAWAPDEQRHFVIREVTDLISLARADYPDQEIEVNVVVHVPQEDDV